MPEIMKAERQPNGRYRVLILVDSHSGCSGTLYYYGERAHAEGCDPGRATACWQFTATAYQVDVDIDLRPPGWLMVYQSDNRGWSSQPYAIVEVRP